MHQKHRECGPAVHIKVFLRMQYIRLLLFYSVIFQSVIFQSCKFHPCEFVRHFPLLQIPVCKFSYPAWITRAPLLYIGIGVDLYSVQLWNLPLKRSDQHVFYFHPHAYPRIERAILPLLLAAEHHRILVGTHFPSNRGYKAELAWVAGHIPGAWYARPKTVTLPSTNRPIVRRSGI